MQSLNFYSELVNAVECSSVHMELCCLGFLPPYLSLWSLFLSSPRCPELGSQVGRFRSGKSCAGERRDEGDREAGCSASEPSTRGWDAKCCQTQTSSPENPSPWPEEPRLSLRWYWRIYLIGAADYYNQNAMATWMAFWSFHIKMLLKYGRVLYAKLTVTQRY